MDIKYILISVFMRIENGYDSIEGYTSRGKFSISDCGGSVEMYTDQGFDIIEIPNGVVARKKL